jgi:hypothetical protein
MGAPHGAHGPKRLLFRGASDTGFKLAPFCVRSVPGKKDVSLRNYVGLGAANSRVRM